MQKKEYDIFISYRRKSGKHTARVLKEAFTRKGFSVFIDLDELKDGQFMDVILSAIDKSRVFMIVMSNDYFDNCANDDDHVRKEILYALEKQKPIIPIVPNKDFSDFPDNTPDDIKNAVSSRQYSFIDMDQLFEESLNKLINERIAPVVKRRQRRLLRIVRWLFRVVLLAVVLFAALFLYVKSQTKDPVDYIDRADAISQKDGVTDPTVPAVDEYAISLYSKGAEGCEKKAEVFYDVYHQARDTSALMDARYYYHNAGYAWQCIQEYDRAIKNYSMAISCSETMLGINANHEHRTAMIYTLNNLAYVYAEKGDFENSLEIINHAIQLDTTSINSYDSKGEILYMAGQMEDSRRIWEIIHTKDPFFVKNPWVDKAFDSQ